MKKKVANFATRCFKVLRGEQNGVVNPTEVGVVFAELHSARGVHLGVVNIGESESESVVIEANFNVYHSRA